MYTIFTSQTRKNNFNRKQKLLSLNCNNFIVIVVRHLLAKSTKDFLEINSIGSKLTKVIIFMMATNVSVINENNSVEDIAITLDELLCKKNEKDLTDLLKTLNLYKTDMDNKSKRTLRKIVEKFYEFLF